MQAQIETFRGVEVSVFVSGSGAGSVGVHKSQVRVKFDPVENARQQADNAQNGEIETCWQQRTAANPRIYNATKFRLHKYDLLSAGGETSPNLLIHVGLTDYKDLLGTHYGPRSSQLVEGAKEQGKDPYAYMSNAIGVGGLTLTQDGHVVLMRRAQWTGEGPGKIDRPGGHPEPENVKQRSNSASVEDLSDGGVLDELFASPQDELRDEVNVPLEEQQEPLLMGLVRDMENGGRCAFDFMIRINYTKDEVIERYNTGKQAEADESIGLLFVPVSEVTKWKFENVSENDFFGNMTAHCRGGLRLLHHYLQRPTK